MLIIIDYAKAFDTIEWDFITHCLNLFGFGPFVKKTIKLLQYNSFSRVEQNGHLSEKIHLSRGCRQGDPISPYLFEICAELLSHVIRGCKDVKGIQIGEMEMKVSQYADDTTLLLNGDKHSLTVVMDILRWFNKMSCLGNTSNYLITLYITFVFLSIPLPISYVISLFFSKPNLCGHSLCTLILFFVTPE